MADAEQCRKRGRKRLRFEADWKRNSRKRLKAAGEEHTNCSGQLVQTKVRSPLRCRCTNKCQDSVSDEEADLIWQRFYEMADYEKQNSYLLGLIDAVPVRRKRTKVESRRQHSFVYRLRLSDGRCIPCAVCIPFQTTGCGLSRAN